MSRSLPILAASLLLVGGCDRAEDAPAQPAAQAERAASGEVVRSHAGTPLPSLSFTDPSGRTLDLETLDGPVLINLWATWCAPCVTEMPQLDALAGELEGEVRVVTISQDIRGAQAVTPFFQKAGFTHLEPWLDPNAAMSAQFAPEGVLPLTVLFDARGREVLRVTGAYEWGNDAAAAMIREALKPR